MKYLKQLDIKSHSIETQTDETLIGKDREDNNKTPMTKGRRATNLMATKGMGKSGRYSIGESTATLDKGDDNVYGNRGIF